MSRTPFDIVKQRMQVQGSLKVFEMERECVFLIFNFSFSFKVQTYSGSGDAAKQLWKHEGFKGNVLAFFFSTNFFSSPS